jgi:hypothetical protein
MATAQEVIDSLYKKMRIVEQQNQQLAANVGRMQAAVRDLLSRPRTITEEIDEIPGRRIETVLSGEVTFTAANAQQRATPITIQVSQDGPFIMTHYPMAIWRTSLPTNATTFGFWRPVASYPLPTQQVGTDIIDLAYELQDGGNQRNFQNAPRGPLFSRPDNIVPCAVPTLWASNSAIIFTPTYNAITFNSGTPPTQGTLHVDLIGYRIVNL